MDDPTALASLDEAPTRLSIRLLGPLELVTDQGVVPLGGPRLRTLFGLLALSAPQVVSRDALIDGVWDCMPPANAAKTLRAHVAHLRRGLASHRVGEVIATRAPGYLLTVPAEAIDVRQFEHGVSEGRRTLAAGAVEASVAHLDAAVQLWRGDVLADCPVGEWARAETVRLQELRLHAIEELLAARLALGQHARVTAELECLALRHPLRERIWELLMLALYRDGRQADALLAYRRARALLVEQLGVEPGPGLRRLEAAILAGEDAIAGSVAPVSPPPVVPPPARTRRQQVLPAPLNRLIGRHDEIAELTIQLTQHRLVTLTGVGGSGKTRLAIAVAATVASSFVDGVTFADLTPLAAPSLLPATVSAAIGIASRADPVEAMTRYLRTKQCLLVLDNCEHIVQACGPLVEALLHACPGLTVLATSHQRLGVQGETVWPVPPLASPPRQPATLDDMRCYDSVQLFLDRCSARSVQSLTDEDAAALAELCAELDGLPLAIELAAARTAVLTVTEIMDRLYDPEMLRSAGQPDRPHHRALDATIAWSYDLLDPEEQAGLRRLSVFAGGFTLPAAEAVLHGGPGRCAVDLLTDLVTKSFVMFEPRPSGARYRLLETIRRWTSDRLAEHPAEERQARVRHAGYFLDLAEQTSLGLRGPDLDVLLDQLASEYGNLQAALAWYAGSPRELRLALALTRYWRIRGRYREGHQRLDEALVRCADAPRDLAGRAAAAVAGFAFLLGKYGDAAALAERALEIQLAIGAPADIATTLCLLGSVARERGDYPGSQAFLERARATPGIDELAVIDLVRSAAFTAWLAGELGTAERLLHDVLRRARRMDDTEDVESARLHLAAVAFYRGQLPAADRLATDALVWFTARDIKEGVAWALNIVGLITLAGGRTREAVTHLGASLAVHHCLGDQWRQASVLEALAAASVRLGHPVRAAELLGLAATIRAAIGVPVPAVERALWVATEEAVNHSITPDERSAAITRAAAMGVADVLATHDLPLPD